MKELLVEGQNGCVAGFDTSSLVDALRRLLGGEAGQEEARRAMGARARAAAERFEYARVLRGYADGLKRLAGVE